MGVHGVSLASGMSMRRVVPVQQGEGLFVKATEHAQAPILCSWLSRQQLSSFLHPPESGQMSDDESGEHLQLGKPTLDAIIEGVAAKLQESPPEKRPNTEPGTSSKGKGE